MNLKNKNETDWTVELTEMELKQDEYEARIVRLVKQLIEIDQLLFPQDTHSQAENEEIAREAA